MLLIIETFIYTDMYKKLIFLFLIQIAATALSLAQAPGGVPYANPEPVDFNLFNTILLIVVPVLIFIIFFWYRRRRKKRKK